MWKNTSFCFLILLSNLFSCYTLIIIRYTSSCHSLHAFYSIFIHTLKFYPTLDSLSHSFYPFLLLFFLLRSVWEGAHQKCFISWRCRHTMALYNGRILFSNLILATSNICLAFLTISEQQDDILRERLILRSLSKVVLPDLEPFLKPIFLWKTFLRDCLTHHNCVTSWPTLMQGGFSC